MGIGECVDKEIIEFNIPNASILLEAVESFVKSTGPRRTIFIARKVPCIHSFFESAIEVGLDDIHLVDFPIIGSGEGLVRLETHHRGVSFKEVLARDLRESLSDNTSLTLDDVFVGILFDGENPLSGIPHLETKK